MRRILNSENLHLLRRMIRNFIPTTEKNEKFSKKSSLAFLMRFLHDFFQRAHAQSSVWIITNHNDVNVHNNRWFSEWVVPTWPKKCRIVFLFVGAGCKSSRVFVVEVELRRTRPNRMELWWNYMNFRNLSDGKLTID